MFLFNARYVRFNVKLAILLVSIVYCVLRAGCCYADSIASSELISNAAQYDGRMITYRGEVIGDVMGRGAYAWANVNDGKNAVGCWMPKELAKGISYTGSYKAQGDLIEVVGVFNRSCAQHGGDLDIHAQLVYGIVAGHAQLEGPNQRKTSLALLLSGLLCLVLIWSQLKRKPGKK